VATLTAIIFRLRYDNGGAIIDNNTKFGVAGDFTILQFLIKGFGVM
jgi:hypothetical protein